MRLGVKAVYGVTCLQLPSRRLAVGNPGGRPFCPDVLVIREITSVRGPADNDLMVRLITEAREAGQRVYYDLDSDPWHPPPMAGLRDRNGNRLSVRQRKQWAPGEHHWRWVRIKEEQMAACDGVIVATRHIARVVSELECPMPPVLLARPGIETAAYTRTFRVERPRSPIRLGWMGTTDFRGPDLSTIVEPLRAALAGRHDVEFVFLGYVEGQQPIEDILGPDFPAPLCKVGWVTLDELPGALAELDCALAPQVPCDWAECRSPTTGLAYAAAGVAALHTPTAEYRRFAALGGCGLADSPEEWQAGITALLEATEEDRAAGWQAARRHDVREAAKAYLALAEEHIDA